MIHSPFDPHLGGLSLALLSEAVLVVAGLTLMFRATKFAIRLVVLALFLAFAAGIVPRLLH